MILSFDLGQQKIYAALSDKGSIVKTLTIETPGVEKGRIGSVTETAKNINRVLQQQNIKARSCVFVLPSAAALTKEMQVPERIAQNDLYPLIRTNFSAMTDAGEEFIVDYLPLDPKNHKTILGLLVRKSILLQCQALAKLLNLRCQQVELHASTVLDYRKLRKIESDKPRLAIYVDGTSSEIFLTDQTHMFIRVAELKAATTPDSSLLKNWAMSFNSTLVATPDQDTRVEAVSEQIRSILQFQLSRSGQRPVEDIFLYGDVTPAFCSEVEQKVFTTVLLPSEKPELLCYIHAITAALDKEKSLNLLDTMQRLSPAQQKEQRRAMLFGVFLLALFTSLLGISAALMQSSTKLEEQIAAHEAYLSSPETKENLTEAQSIQRYLDDYKVYSSDLEAFSTYLDGQYRLKSDYLEGFYQLANQYQVTLQRLSFTTGKLELVCDSINETTAAAFAKAMQDEGHAAEVTFSGYLLENSLVGERYRFTLVATVLEETK